MENLTDPALIWKDREWADMPGFEGLYKISDHGDVWCCTSCCPALTHGDRKGGLTVRLIRQGRIYWPTIQDAVAKTFVANPDPISLTYVGHLNGQRKDNRAANLVWMRKNQLTLQLLEKTAAGKLDRPHRVHLEAEDVLRMREMHATGVDVGVLAIEFSTSSANVRSIIKRESWWHLPEDAKSGQVLSIFGNDAPKSEVA